MIDTIHICTGDFDIASGADLTIVPPSISNVSKEHVNPKPLWYEGNTLIFGTKAYNNDYSHVYITVKPGYLYINFNPRKMVHQHNFLPVSINQFNECVTLLGQVLSSIGITTDMKSFKLSRVDLCKDIEVDHEFRKYIAPLKLLSPKFMAKSTPTIDDGYYLIANGARKYCLYDKVGELKSKDIDCRQLGIDSENIMRGEIRFVKNSSIQTHLGISTLCELTTIENYSRLESIYNRIITYDFFKNGAYSAKSEILDSDNALIKAIKEKYPNKGLDLFCTHKLMTINPSYTVDKLCELLESSGSCSSTVQARKVQLLDIQSFQATSESTEIPSTMLLHELHSKLVA